MLVISAAGDVLHSTFDFGKTQVYSKLVRQAYMSSDSEIVRKIDGSDGLRLLRIAGDQRELLISPDGDRLVAVLRGVVK